MDISPRQLIDMMLEVSAELDAQQENLLRCAREDARAENEYRKARANAYLSTEGKTVAEREARVDKVTDTERYAAHLAGGLSKAALEGVRNKRTQLSVLQTVANAVKAETEFYARGPREVIG